MQNISSKILKILIIFGLFFVVTTTVFGYSTFNNNLSWGMTNNQEVSNLQQFLKDQGHYSGQVTGNYYNQTYKGVVNFQNKYSISPTGYFGPITRAKANEIILQISATSNSVQATNVSSTQTTTTDTSALQARVGALYQQVWALQKKINKNKATTTTTTPPPAPTPSPTPVPPPAPLPLPQPTPTPPPPAPTPAPTPVSTTTDTTSPVVTITSPTAGSTVFGTSTLIFAAANDNVGIAGVQFKIDNLNLGSEDRQYPYSIMWNTLNNTDGNHTITAVARDLSGNVSSLSRVVTVRNTTTTPPPAPTPSPTPVPPPAPLPLPQPTPTPPPPAPTPTPTPVSTTTQRKLVWGAYVGDSSADLGAFETKVGKPVNIRSVFYGFGDSFPMQYSSTIGSQGKTILLFWEPSFGYDSINSGAQDAAIRRFATDAKTYNYPVILSPFHEMNGNWSPWGYGVNGNTPAKFISAWKRIKDIFNSVGATNVKFALVYNSDSVPNVTGNQIPDYYPGDAYVDYVGVDGFNFGNPWVNFQTIFSDPLNQLSRYNKPIYIFSMGSVPGVEKANWIRDSLGVQIYKYPLIQGWVWFNQNGYDGNWLVDSDSNSLQAFKEILPK